MRRARPRPRTTHCSRAQASTPRARGSNTSHMGRIACCRRPYWPRSGAAAARSLASLLREIFCTIPYDNASRTSAHLRRSRDLERVRGSNYTFARKVTFSTKGKKTKNEVLVKKPVGSGTVGLFSNYICEKSIHARCTTRGQHDRQHGACWGRTQCRPSQCPPPSSVARPSRRLVVAGRVLERRSQRGPDRAMSQKHRRFATPSSKKRFGGSWEGLRLSWRRHAVSYLSFRRR